MSMPFNVVAFTSTVIAFFFGSLFNLTYATTADIIQRSQRTPITRIKAALLRVTRKCRRQASMTAEAEGDGVVAAGTPQVHLSAGKATEQEKDEEKREVVQGLNRAANETVAEEVIDTDADRGSFAGIDHTTRRRKVNIDT